MFNNNNLEILGGEKRRGMGTRSGKYVQVWNKSKNKNPHLEVFPKADFLHLLGRMDLEMSHA
jgi:hypothetical protein